MTLNVPTLLCVPKYVDLKRVRLSIRSSNFFVFVLANRSNEFRVRQLTDALQLRVNERIGDLVFIIVKFER
jgi:hypothetical protein